MEKRAAICTFHGFLGEPTDFSNICDSGIPVDLNNGILVNLGYKEALQRIYEQLKSKKPLTAVGYSMGARVALWLDSLFPELFSSLILFSVNPGLVDKGERRERLLSDEEWAKRFLHDEWDDVMTSWNSQKVFMGTKVRWSEQNREIASKQILQWSLARQPDFTPHLQSIKKSVVVVAGENDPKFAAIARQIEALENEKIKIVVLPSVGHRILLDCADTARKIIIENTFQ